MSWQDYAACIGQWDTYDAVLDRSKDDDARRAAETICTPCPVKAECAAFRNRHRLSGTWGGTTNTWRIT